MDSTLPHRHRLLWHYIPLIIPVLILTLILPLPLPIPLRTSLPLPSPVQPPRCPQPPLLKPHNPLLPQLLSSLSHPTFPTLAAHQLSQSVRIPTETWDDFGPVGEDDRWDKFGAFHDWLEGAFPAIHETLRKERVNTWGLVYTWQGYEPELKPLMLAAHQDVVPVDQDTLDQWTHPPFSGHYDGTWIWGRGSCDDKAGLVGIMIALELLVQHGFRPRRTILLAFGFNEESSSFEGAGQISSFLYDRYGQNGICAILDEGAGYQSLLGTMYATPAVGEKGYLDVQLSVLAQGGHSSTPPKHTAIGILASIITVLETNPPEAKLTRTNPLYQTLRCVAEYSPSLPAGAKRLIESSEHSDSALSQLGNWVLHALPSNALLPTGGALMSTTQAVDVVRGGVKANVLPERAWALVNHRIGVDESSERVKARLRELLAPEASSWNLSFEAFPEASSASSASASASASGQEESGAVRQRQGEASVAVAGKGKLVLSTMFDPLEPAPFTPTEGGVWDVLGGTIRAVFSHNQGLPLGSVSSAQEGIAGVQHQHPVQAEAGAPVPPAPAPDEEIHIAPALMTGNTDTAHYWPLTPHIFRYAHFRPEGIRNGYHTVDEAMSVQNFVAGIEFWVLLVLNFDEAGLE
ncbi:carboxypeptidase S [Dacryopinax primogenitus]|uniref:Carboxypeptidase S n=1 Tax=Dacryopinax primogenitus (strain DJM 731) TaxID=1858805 RepID=M5FRV3_DACPD|nr:carboxypeptidase S [Dacryopinax primogenitus]EJT98488.1 carboxypeptidase S [Dacryopinax primogenitus]